MAATDATDSQAAATPLEEKILLNRHDVAALLGISPDSVIRLAKQGQIPSPGRVGKRPRWHRSVIQRYLETIAQASEPAVEPAEGTVG